MSYEDNCDKECKWWVPTGPTSIHWDRFEECKRMCYKVQKILSSKKKIRKKNNVYIIVKR